MNEEGDTEEVQEPNPESQVKKKLGGYENIVDKSLWIKVDHEHRLLQWCRLSLNPVVTIISICIILAFVTWAIVVPEAASLEIGSWKAWIGLHFTWLYISTQNIWLIFVIAIFFSKYSDIKLGEEDSVPEYSYVSWFSMLFSCGVSTGLFFFGVAEPVLHYTEKNRYSADPTLPDNKLAQEAINITLYHWGLHAWVVYTLMGLILALMSHREGLPMTLKSCFYPLIGEKIFGWPGDLVDILSVIATVFGVCTSLGLGTIQINEGLHMMNENIEISTRVQVSIIWLITAVATISVVSGVKYGIRRISETCFGLGVILMCIVLLLDNTVFLLNLYTQSMGYYFNWLLQTGYHSDAFEQLGESAGSADRNRYLPTGVESADGPAEWMDWWTLFFWGWWIAWCPFVGMFIAKISYGRTVKEFIVGTMAAPVTYVFMWLVIFGGAGLRMEREAAKQDLCCHNLNVSHLITLGNTANQTHIAFSDDLCLGVDACNPCAVRLITNRTSQGLRYNDLTTEIEEVGVRNWGYTVPSRTFTRLSCRAVEQMWFDLMLSYGDLGFFLSLFSLVSLILYFVTSSDSGSLVIDSLASNGHPDPPPIQRISWAVLEGLCATALLVAGGNKALQALQAVAIGTGLIYIFLIGLSCVALWRALKLAAGEVCIQKGRFAIDIMDTLLADPLTELFSKQYRQRTRGKIQLFFQFLTNIFTAPLSVARCNSLLNGSFVPSLVFHAAFLALAVLLHIFQTVVEGLWALAWVSYFMFSFSVGLLRMEARQRLSIPGNVLEDIILSVTLYPAVVLQMLTTLQQQQQGKTQLDQIQLRKCSENGALNAAISHDNIQLTLDKDDTTKNKDDQAFRKDDTKPRKVSNGRHTTVVCNDEK